MSCLYLLSLLHLSQSPLVLIPHCHSASLSPQAASAKLAMLSPSARNPHGKHFNCSSTGTLHFLFILRLSYDSCFRCHRHVLDPNMLNGTEVFCIGSCCWTRNPLLVLCCDWQRQPSICAMLYFSVYIHYWKIDSETHSACLFFST